ncbi:hypothetical protein [Hymenobacter sedentarius]|uniref:hypothetical protein n=1 Tax=Hymenobacter sedentarius TaxID=1411621 RepID=UPI000AF64980|nr:hypothetical protein [Hymenobacter sedentarius]
MNNVRLLIDFLLAASALTSPLFYSAPATPKATGLVKLISPLEATRRPTTTRREKKTKSFIPHSLKYTVTATIYEAVPGQTDDEPFVTADNSHIKPHYGTKKRWMALSRDLLKPWGGEFQFGDTVRVTGISAKLDGVYTIHDTMNKRHHHCMDVLAHPSENLDIFTKGVKIQKVTLE